MSEVKRFIDVSDCMEEFSEGPWVSYKDYAEIKAQRDALGVECSHYKSVAEKMADRADDYKSENFGYSCFDSSNEIKQDLTTPATDAYLNSVRAEGVEMFAAALKDKYQGIAYELIGNYETNGEEDRISDEGEIQEALAFAAILRTGEPS